MIGNCDADPSDVRIRDCLQATIGNADAQVKNYSLIALGQVGTRGGHGDGSEKIREEVRALLRSHLAQGKTQMKPWASIAIGVMERGLSKSSGASPGGFLAPVYDAAKSNYPEYMARSTQDACAIATDSLPAVGPNNITLESTSLGQALAVLTELPQELIAMTASIIAIGMLGDKDPTSWHSKYSVALNYRSCTDTLANLEGDGLLNLY